MSSVTKFESIFAEFIDDLKSREKIIVDLTAENAALKQQLANFKKHLKGLEGLFVSMETEKDDAEPAEQVVMATPPANANSKKRSRAIEDSDSEDESDCESVVSLSDEESDPDESQARGYQEDNALKEFHAANALVSMETVKDDADPAEQVVMATPPANAQPPAIRAEDNDPTPEKKRRKVMASTLFFEAHRHIYPTRTEAMDMWKKLTKSNETKLRFIAKANKLNGQIPNDRRAIILQKISKH